MGYTPAAAPCAGVFSVSSMRFFWFFCAFWDFWFLGEFLGALLFFAIPTSLADDPPPVSAAPNRGRAARRRSHPGVPLLHAPSVRTREEPPPQKQAE